MDIYSIDNLKVFHAKSGLFYPFKLDICFFIADDLMIDAGSNWIVKKSIKYLDKIDISACIITHIHEDHTGLAHYLDKVKKIPIYIHKKSIEEAKTKSNVPLYRYLVWGDRKPFKALPAPKKLSTKNYNFDIYHAPGHHNYHILIHEKNMGWIFTGDIYITPKQYVAFKDENISDAIKTLKFILSLDFDTMFCSHSGIQKNAKEKILQKLYFFEDIKEKATELYNKGFSIEEIEKIIFPKKRLWEYVSRGEWSSSRIIKTLLPENKNGK